MLLNDVDIRHRCECNGMIVPFDADNLQPASYDVTLGNEFLEQSGGVVDPFLGTNTSKVTKYVQETYVLPPGEFVLGTTREVVHIPANIGARFEGKSSLGRIGLCTHVTAGFIDPGFNGNITVELCNLGDSDIVLHEGMRIGQICFYCMNADAEAPYGSDNGNHYQGQSGVTAAWYSSNL